MRALTTAEHRSRRLFNYIMQKSINEDIMNKPGRAASGTLHALIDELQDSVRGAERAGCKAPLGDPNGVGYDPERVAVLSAMIAAHAYALARNAGTLNDIDLPKVADRLDAMDA